MPTLSEAIAMSEWVNALTADERRVVEAETVARVVPKGGYVCHKGEPVRHWIGVVDGLVKITTVSTQGKLATFSGVPSGGWFGEGSLLKDELRHYDAVALRRSQIACLPRSIFQWLLANNTQFTRFLLTQLNARLGQAMAIIEHERLLGPESRVAQCLANLLNPTLHPGVGSTLRISQEEIALLAGLSRQRVNQALQSLRQKNLLQIECRTLRIMEIEKLRSFRQ